MCVAKIAEYDSCLEKPTLTSLSCIILSLSIFLSKNLIH